MTLLIRKDCHALLQSFVLLLFSNRPSDASPPLLTSPFPPLSLASQLRPRNRSIRSRLSLRSHRSSPPTQPIRISRSLPRRPRRPSPSKRWSGRRFRSARTHQGYGAEDPDRYLRYFPAGSFRTLISLSLSRSKRRQKLTSSLSFGFARVSSSPWPTSSTPSSTPPSPSLKPPRSSSPTRRRSRRWRCCSSRGRRTRRRSKGRGRFGSARWRWRICLRVNDLV